MHLCSSIDHCPWSTLHQHAIDILIDTQSTTQSSICDSWRSVDSLTCIDRLDGMNAAKWLRLRCQSTVRLSFGGDVDLDVHDMCPWHVNWGSIEGIDWHSTLDAFCMHDTRLTLVVYTYIKSLHIFMKFILPVLGELCKYSMVCHIRSKLKSKNSFVLTISCHRLSKAYLITHRYIKIIWVTKKVHLSFERQIVCCSAAIYAIALDESTDLCS